MKHSSNEIVKRKDLIEICVLMNVVELYMSISNWYTPHAKYKRRVSVVQHGKLIFNDIKPLLFKEICLKWKYCKKQKKMASDIISLVSSIVPLVASATGHNHPFFAIPVSILLVKIGLSQFCKCKN